MIAYLNGEKCLVHFSASPPPFAAGQRQTDLDAILYVIRTAKEYINIEVMYYLPTTYYMNEN